MWVFCCGMYRSASTLQFQITARLVKENQLGQQVGWIDANRFSEMRDAYANVEGLKVIKVHRCTPSIASEFMHNQAIGIYTFRDIRDVYVSSMSQRMKSFEFIWAEEFIESCLEEFKRWTQPPNVLVSKYEEIIADVPKEVKRIANHLGIPMEPHQYIAVAADYSLQSQQRRIEKFKQQLLQRERDPNDHRELVDYHDEENLLHLNHIASGKTERWKEYLSAQEVELIEQRVKTWCAENDFSPALFLRDVLQLERNQLNH
ncbi:sulfotransferase domain-containing protein [Phormidium tenue FACHB-886]|nr:sulfotransferase domain-containing protein [Phormidium tenue FACHB-886]